MRLKLIVIVRLLFVSFGLSCVSLVAAINGNIFGIVLCVLSATVFALSADYFREHRREYDDDMEELFPDV